MRCVRISISFFFFSKKTHMGGMLCRCCHNGAAGCGCGVPRRKQSTGWSCKGDSLHGPAADPGTAQAPTTGGRAHSHETVVAKGARDRALPPGQALVAPISVLALAPSMMPSYPPIRPMPLAKTSSTHKACAHATAGRKWTNVSLFATALGRKGWGRIVHMAMCLAMVQTDKDSRDSL